MAHTYSSIFVHCVFSTKNREPLVAKEWRDRLWAFMGGIARENRMKALEVGGYFDHAHMLLSIPPVMAVSKAMQLIKGGSSLFVHQTFPRVRGFEWQEGFGAFSISRSQIDETVEYIRAQDEHHRSRTFQEEYLEFLERNGVEYDPKYIWG